MTNEFISIVDGTTLNLEVAANSIHLEGIVFNKALIISCSNFRINKLTIKIRGFN